MLRGFSPRAGTRRVRVCAGVRLAAILAVMTAISTQNAGNLPGSRMAKGAVFDGPRDTGGRFDGRLVTEFAEMVALGAVTA